jgi:uroporphyrinogen-III synthase
VRHWRSLAEAGMASASLPLLAIEAIEPDTAQLERLRGIDQAQAIIVVSKPAARLLLEQLDQAGIAPPPRLVHGGRGNGADPAGPRAGGNLPASGDDSEALLGLPALREAIARRPRVLIVRGVGGRELLAERLAEQGASVDYLELYRRCLPHIRRVRWRAASKRNASMAWWSAVGRVLNTCSRAGADWPRLARLPLFVPSPRVAEQARALGPTGCGLPWRQCRGLAGSRAANCCTCPLRR